MPNLRISALCLALLAAGAGPSASAASGDSMVLAQAAPAGQETPVGQDTPAPQARQRGPLPPLPPAKTAIGTELPTPGIPGEPKSSPAQPDTTSVETAAAVSADSLDTASSVADSTVAWRSPPIAQEDTTLTSGVPPEDAVPLGVSTTAAVTGAAQATAATPGVSVPGVPQLSAPQPTPAPAELAAPSTKLVEERSLFNVSTDNLRTMKLVIDDQFNLRGMVYGEEQGYLRILEADNNGDFREVWKSPILNSPVRGVFVDNLDGDGDTEIVAYTADGSIYIYDYTTHERIFRTPEGQYRRINCMVVANVDSDPQLELLFIAGRSVGGNDTAAGNLIQFDTVNQFEEWTSSELYTATDMAFGNVDSDDEPEIVLNTGEILSFRFKDIKWKSPQGFGDRLYLIDLDSDGILELVCETDDTYIRVFDIDQRREKW